MKQMLSERQLVVIVEEMLMFGGLKLSKKKPKKDKKKISKYKKEVAPGQKPRTLSGGSIATKCRFCGKWNPMSQAWNCCYADKFETVIDFRNNIARVKTKDEDVEIIDVDIPEVDSDGES